MDGKSGLKLMSITIKDVAKKAGVSCATVSLALRPDTPIAEKTRQKVLRIVNETGYRPKIGRAHV